MANWIKVNKQLRKEFTFRDFREAMAFVNKVAELAEGQNHHPDIMLYRYKHVRLMLTSYSEGKVTEADYKLAELIDKS
jgi:4a-hydroxytetrahydrobiopterin dehydratase